MNYGETIAYWYLRLNGFFLIQNFVIHRTEEIKYSSDIDILGIRLPYVFEEVGGQKDDWDKALLEKLNPNLATGIICEVKTGGFEEEDLFKRERLTYCLDRFGFAPNLSNATENIFKNSIYTGENFQIVKLFISHEKAMREDFIQLRINDCRQFIEKRINNYKKKKWQDRLFFQSDYLGNKIDELYNKRE